MPMLLIMIGIRDAWTLRYSRCLDALLTLCIRDVQNIFFDLFYYP